MDRVGSSIVDVFICYGGRSNLRRIYMDFWVLVNGAIRWLGFGRSKFGRLKSKKKFKEEVFNWFIGVGIKWV